jgi:hypothetical protein
MIKTWLSSDKSSRRLRTRRDLIRFVDMNAARGDGGQLSASELLTSSDLHTTPYYPGTPAYWARLGSQCCTPVDSQQRPAEEARAGQGNAYAIRVPQSTLEYRVPGPGFNGPSYTWRLT